MCGQKSDGDRGAVEEKERKSKTSGWITSGTTCRRENCQGMKHNMPEGTHKKHRPHIKSERKTVSAHMTIALVFRQLYPDCIV